MRERWATFDCYGTLIDWERGIGDAMAELWPDADRDALLRDYHAVEPRVQEGRALPYRDAMARALRAVAAIHSLAVPPGREDALGESLPSWPPFPEVPSALAQLRDRGWRLAILSNTDPDLLAGSIDRIGVDVDRTVTVAEAGSYKPARGHWDAFFRLTGADRAAHAHVAASPFHDVAPAGGLGLRVVWIDRKGEGSDLPRDATLPDLRGLPETLDRLVPP